MASILGQFNNGPLEKIDLEEDFNMDMDFNIYYCMNDIFWGPQKPRCSKKYLFEMVPDVIKNPFISFPTLVPKGELSYINVRNLSWLDPTEPDNQDIKQDDEIVVIDEDIAIKFLNSDATIKHILEILEYYKVTRLEGKNFLIKFMETTSFAKTVLEIERGN